MQGAAGCERFGQVGGRDGKRAEYLDVHGEPLGLQAAERGAEVTVGFVPIGLEEEVGHVRVLQARVRLDRAEVDPLLMEDGEDLRE